MIIIHGMVLLWKRLYPALRAVMIDELMSHLLTMSGVTPRRPTSRAAVLDAIEAAKEESRTASKEEEEPGRAELMSIFCDSLPTALKLPPLLNPSLELPSSAELLDLALALEFALAFPLPITTGAGASGFTTAALPPPLLFIAKAPRLCSFATPCLNWARARLSQSSNPAFSAASYRREEIQRYQQQKWRDRGSRIRQAPKGEVGCLSVLWQDLRRQT
jgi:hypothetical protein